MYKFIKLAEWQGFFFGILLGLVWFTVYNGIQWSEKSEWYLELISWRNY